MLRSLLREERFIAAPGVHDGFSALLADRFPFDAVYMSGYCVAASRFGLPDAGLIGLSDMLQVVNLIRRCTDKPLIADADTGYGGLLNVQHTVREYEAAGVNAIQIEDQETPKKCGHTKGKRVIDASEMSAKVEVAAESRNDDSFLIIARTDALATHGLDEAIRRARLYRRAGADVVFIDALDSQEAMERAGEALGGEGPLMINITPQMPGFVTPEASIEELSALGFAIAIFPGLFATPSLAAMEAAAQTLLNTGRQPAAAGSSLAPAHELVGFPKVWADEARWQARYQNGGGTT
ncbi:isocitrate lyase/PEP mutase family protein [Hyphococcus sp.]|uniref:isocitrate lyase/PEP mutase family protein n=1 Tax=Hyphococcus sp. TaxID=2038636 RepID=UPI0035C6E541